MKKSNDDEYLEFPVFKKKKRKRKGSFASMMLGSKNVAMLEETFVYETPILGKRASIQSAQLTVDGVLVCKPGFVWDFGSGPAIDTQEMIVASLAHDAICRMNDQGWLTMEDRYMGDKFFHELLIRYGAGRLRAGWSYLAVSAYSRLQALLR